MCLKNIHQLYNIFLFKKKKKLYYIFICQTLTLLSNNYSIFHGLFQFGSKYLFLTKTYERLEHKNLVYGIKFNNYIIVHFF